MGNFPVWMSVVLIVLGMALYVGAFFRRRQERIEQQFNWLSGAEVPKTHSDFLNIGADSDASSPRSMFAFSHGSGHGADNFIGDFYLKHSEKEHLPVAFYAAEKTLSFIMGAILALLLSSVLDVFQEQILSRIIVGAAGGATGIILLKLGNLRYAHFKRQRFERHSPEILDFLILAVETGMTIDRALAEVTTSLALMNPTVAAELSSLCKELSILLNREQAFDNLIKRTRSKTFKSLKSHLIQGEKYGVPIGKSLRMVSAEARNVALSQEQEKARKLPVFISIPLMLLILPPIVVISTGPGFVQLMRTF